MIKVIAIITSVSITYPDQFKLYFNYPDILGHLLNFDKCGEDYAITPYQHVIRNIDCYDGFHGVCRIPTKLTIEPYNYFYIQSPELGSVDGKQPMPYILDVVYFTNHRHETAIDTNLSTICYYDPPLSNISEVHFTLTLSRWSIS